MLRFLTAGESHGPALTLIVEGLPAGLMISEAVFNEALGRRQKGYGRGGRMQIERDQVEILSGVRFGVTLGSPVSLVIRNRDWENWQEDMSVCGKARDNKAVYEPRPGHADLVGVWKYGHKDARPVLERASARKTAARVAAGVLAGCILEAVGMRTAAHVRAIGGAALPETVRPGVDEILRYAYVSDVSCIDEPTAAAMRAEIDRAKAGGDTVGGVVEVIAERVIPGLGSYVHWDRRLDGKLAQALMSIPAFKAVEIGEGIKGAASFGSQVHDEILPDGEDGVGRGSNRAGGLEAGVTNGEALVVKGFMKPIPTLVKPLASIDLRTGKAATAAAERSDTCAVPAAAVVAESMVKWALAAEVLEKFSSDTLNDLMASVGHYRTRLAQEGHGPCKW